MKKTRYVLFGLTALITGLSSGLATLAEAQSTITIRSQYKNGNDMVPGTVAGCISADGTTLSPCLQPTGGGGGGGTVTQGPAGSAAAPWYVAEQVLETAVGAQGATAPNGFFVGGGIYSTTPPTLTNGQTGRLQLTASGSVRVDAGGSGFTLASTSLTAATPVPVSATNAANTLANPLFFSPVGGGNALYVVKAAGSDGGNASLTTGYWYALAPAEATAAGAVQPKGDSYGAAYSDNEGLKPSFTVWNQVTPIAGISYSFCGSATKVVRVRDISVQAVAGTAGGGSFSVVKTSTAPTGGTSTTSSGFVALNGGSATAASPLLYSVVPTTGTSLGIVLLSALAYPVIGNAVAPIDKKYGPVDNTQTLTLNGAAQCLQFSFSTPPASPTAFIGVTTTESTN